MYRFGVGPPGDRASQRTFSARKPPDRFRIFVIGGSTAAGVPYPVNLGFSGWLERALDAALPQADVEVVNAAVSGYASRRVLLAAREIAEYEPDPHVRFATASDVGCVVTFASPETMVT